MFVVHAMMIVILSYSVTDIRKYEKCQDYLCSSSQIATYLKSISEILKWKEKFVQPVNFISGTRATSHWWIWGAARDARSLWVQLLSFSRSFYGKFGQRIGWHPYLGSWRLPPPPPPVWEILDSPLQVVKACWNQLSYKNMQREQKRTYEKVQRIKRKAREINMRNQRRHQWHWQWEGFRWSPAIHVHWQ